MIRLPIFTVDGNIGSGKSTTLEYLHRHYGVPIDLEPVARWQPFLEDMYAGHTGVFDFQTRVWLDRCWLQPRNSDSSVLMERSPFFQRMVFVEAIREGREITERQYQLLNEMYQRTFYQWEPMGYIYLRTNPDACAGRIRRRGRPSEEAISADYLRMLHRLHESAYIHAASSGFPVVLIDAEGKSVDRVAAEIWHALHYFIGFVPPAAAGRPRVPVRFPPPPLPPWLWPQPPPPPPPRRPSTPGGQQEISP